MSHRGGGVALLVAVLLVGVGCAGKPPLTHYYTLAPSPDGVAAEREGRTLLVRQFVVDPPYDQDRLVYREAIGSGEIGYYNYHRWASPLGRLAAVAVATGLEGAPGVAVAEPSAIRPAYDAVLGGRVVRIEEVGTPSGVSARVAIDFRLIRGATGELLWSGTLAAETSGPVAEGARSMALVQSAFGQIVGQLRTEIASALESLDAQDD